MSILDSMPTKPLARLILIMTDNSRLMNLEELLNHVAILLAKRNVKWSSRSPTKTEMPESVSKNSNTKGVIKVQLEDE